MYSCYFSFSSVSLYCKYFWRFFPHRSPTLRLMMTWKKVKGVLLLFMKILRMMMIVALSSKSQNYLNRQSLYMLARIVIVVMTVRSDMDAFVVNVLYLDKYLPQQSSADGLVEQKFLSNFVWFVLWMIQNKASKNGKFCRNQTFLFQFWFS